MISITMDGINTDKINATTRYEPVPAGQHTLAIAKTREGALCTRLSRSTQEDGTPKFTLSVFYSVVGEKKYKGINYNVDVLGSKTVVAKKGANAGQSFNIDFRGNLFQFLLNYGFTKEEVKAANISFSALEDEVALEEAGFKGVETDILVNGQSIADRLTSTKVVGEVKISTKGNPYVVSISAA